MPRENRIWEHDPHQLYGASPPGRRYRDVTPCDAAWDGWNEIADDLERAVQQSNEMLLEEMWPECSEFEDKLVRYMMVEDCQLEDAQLDDMLREYMEFEDVMMEEMLLQYMIFEGMRVEYRY
jgi:hypothetical protein